MTGLTEFGANDYLEGLTVLLAALDTDCPLTVNGRLAMWDDLTQALASRMRAVAGLREHTPPAVSAPIVITGVPRTGTTALHKLMSVDPQFQGLNRWLADYPLPRPDPTTWPNNEHFRDVERRLNSRYAQSPGLKPVHIEVAAEVDECLTVLRQGFTSNRFGSRSRVPSYDEWLRSADQGPSYDWYARNLALIGFGDDRRWLLKNPSHLLQLGLLFATFPDAVVIQTHRDLTSAIPSFCSLLAMVRRANEADVRLPEIGERELRVWSEGLRTAMEFRRQDQHRTVDVYHQDFDRNPIGVIADIYGQIGLELTAEVRAAMRVRVDSDRDHQLRGHRYDAADFGLDRSRIENAFGDYADELRARPA